jgi:NTE family protein
VSSALVLGGGGITGIAWEVGVLAGLRQAGTDRTGADLIVGTSAGSVVGTHIAAGVDLEKMVAEQRMAPVDDFPAVDMGPVMQAFAIMADRQLDPRTARAKVGALALAAQVVDEETQIARFESGLPGAEWPDRRLIITGVDAETGEAVTWDRTSGVPLVRAIAASCAVPCVFPPITINGRRYMDGGVRSGTNADLATGADEIIVVAPMAAFAPPVELAALREHARVTLIQPDAAALEAIGPNVLDPSRRTLALEAGLLQGAALARA